VRVVVHTAREWTRLTRWHLSEQNQALRQREHSASDSWELQLAARTA
jgi:hypothetical protein